MIKAEAQNSLAGARLHIQSLAGKLRREVGFRWKRNLLLANAPFLAAALDDLRREAAGQDIEPAEVEWLQALLFDCAAKLSPDTGRTSLPSPAVTVTMVSRNRAHCIGDAIESVQNQSFQDWELVIVDDGSTDRTKEVVARYLGDERIRYHWQAASGMASARNHSLRLARGELVAYLDDDNLFYSGVLESAVGMFSRDGDLECLYGALVTGAHRRRREPWIMLEPFDRERLLRENFLDMGVLVHRRSVIERYGGIDEDIDTCCDWDFALRVTAHKPAMRLPVLSTRYRVMDEHRLSTTHAVGVDQFKVQRKWLSRPTASRMPRVLFMVGRQTELEESHVATLLRCMRRWKVDIVEWYPEPAASHADGSPAHSGDETLSAAIDREKPDIVHLHGLAAARIFSACVHRGDMPATVWVSDDRLAEPDFNTLLEQSWVRRVYSLSKGGPSPKARTLKPAFDTSVFQPSVDKDASLVLQVARTPSDAQVGAFLRIAARCPDHRFVLALSSDGGEADTLRAEFDRQPTSCELMLDLPRDELAALQGRAALYLHTAGSLEKGAFITAEAATAIAEAMSTGALVVMPKRNALAAEMKAAGRHYRRVGEAAALINETAGWSEAEWRQASVRSVNWSFRNMADELVLRPLFDDWCAVLDAT